MEYLGYVFVAVLAVVSVVSIIFCIVRGKGVSHKILVLFTLLLCVVAIICFGGNAILFVLGMGWRCKPFNIMLHLCVVLSISILLCSIWRFIRLKEEDTNPALIWCGIISMSLALIVIQTSSWVYFNFTSFGDAFTEYDGQTIVYETNGHGSYGSIWRYYLPVNDLVHGVEITQEGWHGVRPWEHTS